ncbi:MAG: alpha/beta hydrolase [Planctomycetes bacterium]|nr:alpha/beta hydrolase [Planctomycetota bacterium]
MRFTSYLTPVCLLVCFSFASAAYGDTSYEQHKNLVYAETDGVGLVLDVFVPKEKKNGLAIVDVASGAWHSDRSKIGDHKRAKMFETMCQRGFVVFAVRPGSITKFSGKEMLTNVHSGIQWVKAHAEEYGIAADKLGLIGASAGGHLASLAAVTADDSTRVAAVAVFFPPTDFLEYGDSTNGQGANPTVNKLFPLMAFGVGNTEGKTPEELVSALKAVSPLYHVSESAPPFLLIHGDADMSVPLNQSQKLQKALQEKGVPAQLIIKKGGGHPWPTIHEEVAIMADWFVEKL